jgi:adenosylcobyric acid synthase
MLGRLLRDPERIESDIEAVEGLGLLDVETTMTGDKRLRPVSGVSMPDGTPFSGYEMHVGTTFGPDRLRPFARLSGGDDEGAISQGGNVAGSYCHGLFADDRQRARLLAWIGAEPSPLVYEAEIERVLDGLADHLAAHLDIEGLLDLSRMQG